ncbi:MAG: hypothetical protein NVSMB13_20360 [Mycobacteriales bacterium]
MRQLAEERAAARAGKDYAASDALREQIAAAGWLVRDAPEGYTLSVRPPYAVLANVRELPDRSQQPDDRPGSVAVLAEGWPDDLRTCLEALVENAPSEVGIMVLDLGNAEGAGQVVHEVATTAPGRVEAWHLDRACGWAEARTALLRADTAAVHIWLDPSSVLTGDAISPVLAAFEDPSVVAAGWRGVSADPDWLGFSDAAPGEVDALLGYLFGMRRSAALAAGGPHPKARFYRNADMEFSFALREAGRGSGCDRLVMTEPLPVTQGRHHGYHDTPTGYREKESKRTYDRFLQRFRGRADLLAPRAP